MTKSIFSKILAMMLVVIMVACVLPLNVLAATAVGGYDDSHGGSDYYNVISERSWDIAPGKVLLGYNLQVVSARALTLGPRGFCVTEE